MKRLTTVLLLAAALAAVLTGCGANGQAPEQNEIDLADPRNGNLITSAGDLRLFLAEGVTDTCNLGANIDLGAQMITIGTERGPIVIEGNGYAITGQSDCVLRLLDGATVILNELRVEGGIDGIGVVGSATLGGVGGSVTGRLHGVQAGGKLSFGQACELTFTGSTGCGVTANAMVLHQDGKLTAYGGVSAVNVTEHSLILREGAALQAYALGEEQYNAVKVAGALALEARSIFEVENPAYHGAELGSVDVDPTATIRATGGSFGVGLFLLSLQEDYTAYGFCEPAERHDTGKGSITFID